MASQFQSKYDPITDKYIKPEISIDPYSGLNKYNKQESTLEKKDSTVDPTLEGITKEEYDTLIDSLTNHPEYFGPDYAGTYPKGFGEAVIKVFTQAIAFEEAFSQMSPEQKLNMFRNTNKFREKIMSEIKELGIKKDLFDGGILSSEEMSSENIFSRLITLFNNSTQPDGKATGTNKQETIKDTQPDGKATGTNKTHIKQPWKYGGQRGGAWPVSSIFSDMTSIEEDASNIANFLQLSGTTFGIAANGVMGLGIPVNGVMGLSGLLLALSSIGISIGVYIALKISCKIAKTIIYKNYPSYQPTIGDNQTGPVEIVKKWFQTGYRIWRGLGLQRTAPMPDMPQMQEYNGSILDYIQSNVGNVADYMGDIIIRKMSQPGFALFGTICTVGDIATNLITAPFYGFAYLAKKMFGRNINAVIPVNEDEAQINPLAPKDLSQRVLTPIDRYTKNITLFNENILYSLTDKDVKDNYDTLEKKLDLKYKTCLFCTTHICNNGRYIQCRTCVNGVYHYDNIIGGCNFAIEVCQRSNNINNKYRCPNCREPWRLCTGNTLSLLPEDTDDKGFSVVDGPCLKPDNIALTDNEIIADNKTLIGILDKHLTEELKTQIARGPGRTILDRIVSLTATKKQGDNELDRNVSTKITAKPSSGGSKKQKNKTKRRKNKNTRHRRRRTRR
jgi:hypothetical protein